MKRILPLIMILQIGCNMAPMQAIGDGDETMQPVDQADMQLQTLDDVRTKCEIETPEREALFVMLVDLIQDGKDFGTLAEDQIPIAGDFCEVDNPSWIIEVCELCAPSIIDFIYSD